MRVELGEIEAALEAYADVRQGVVVPPRNGDVALTAYVKLRDGVRDAPGWTEALRAHLATRLPPYMVPQQIVAVDSLKLTASGKVDRNALRAAPTAQPSADVVPPANEVERWLRAECEGLLGHRLGVAENIFDAGFTSLTAAQLITRIRRRFGADVPLVRIFEYPTVSALAPHLAARDDRADGLTGAVAKARERAERRRAGRPSSRERG